MDCSVSVGVFRLMLVLTSLSSRASLSFQPSRLLTGSADGKVRSFSYPENAFDGFVTSAGAVPIRWIAVDRAGERLVVVSECVGAFPPSHSTLTPQNSELIIKVVHLDDTTRTTLITASKPMRSASWHPTNGTLVGAA